MDIAFLIIDMQNGCREGSGCKEKEAFDEAVEHINEAARMFREKGAPVVIVQDREVGGGPGSREFEVVQAINRADTDVVVHKDFCNSFWRTELESILREKGIRFVVVSGFAAEYCVLFTYNGAVERGFGASLLQKGFAGATEEGIRAAQLLRPVVSLQALEYMLNRQ
jgi:nicotinamidase-related amidase